MSVIQHSLFSTRTKPLFHPNSKWKGDCWIPYEAADDVLNMLQGLLESPHSHRPPCRLIYGNTNNGKTSIAREFVRTINRQAPRRNDGKNIPVLYVQTPSNSSLGMLYTNLLRKAGFPSIPKSIDDKAFMVFDRLPAIGVRMIIIDEIHDVLKGKSDKRNELLGGIKNLSNELCIPMVLIGTEAARAAIQTDQQLGNRFVPLCIPTWEVNRNYAAFLQQVFKYWGMDGREILKNKKGLGAIYYQTQGLTGETMNFVRELAKAIECQRDACLTRQNRFEDDGHSGKLEIITHEELHALIPEIDWVRPDDRRWG